MTEYVLELLVRELGIPAEDVFAVPGLLDLTGLWTIYGLDRAGPQGRPRSCPDQPALAERGDRRATGRARRLRDGDVLVHHPYDSFSTSVQRFIEQAAADPKVLAIKQTLYRTSGDSPIVDALIDAAAGRQAGASRWWRSRPASTSRPTSRGRASWSRPGVHVVYGLVGPEDPLQDCLVVRHEGDELAATATSAPATTTPRPPASTRTWACSPPTRPSART